MNVLDSYRIDFKNMKSEKLDFWFHLDDAFFQAVDGPEIKQGDLNAHLTVRKTTGAFECHIDITGTIQIVCDRCLDLTNLPINIDTLIKVRLGEEFDDDGEWITIPEEDDVFDLSWLLYEIVALEIPLQHVHEPGACNESMISALETHGATLREADEDEDEDLSEIKDEDKPIDPRWNELKKILDNN